jgi:hypothetical protein
MRGTNVACRTHAGVEKGSEALGRELSSLLVLGRFTVYPEFFSFIREACLLLAASERQQRGSREAAAIL